MTLLQKIRYRSIEEGMVCQALASTRVYAHMWVQDSTNPVEKQDGNRQESVLSFSHVGPGEDHSIYNNNNSKTVL